MKIVVFTTKDRSVITITDPLNSEKKTIDNFVTLVTSEMIISSTWGHCESEIP